jgi:hypothetical protein
MTLELKRVSNTSASPDAADQGTPAEKTGSLVINLCKVGAPIAIPQPRSPQLMRFSFFLSHSWQGSRRKYRLQMGYFSTHVEANRWLKILGGIYPGAFVSDVSAAQAEPLSDKQVLRIFEQRGAGGADGRSSADETEADDISLLRPEETGTRPGLRPGVFSDAICAKRVAQCVGSDFESVAIIPVSSQQQATVIATGKTSTGAVFATSAHHRPATVGKSVEARYGSANRAPLPLQQQGTVSGLREVGDEQYGVTVPTPERPPRGTFKETLEILGTIEFDVGSEEEINGTGMQDLRIELQKESPLKQTSRRSGLWTRKP